MFTIYVGKWFYSKGNNNNSIYFLAYKYKPTLRSYVLEV